MPKLRVLIVHFDFELLQEQLPYLRASISEIAGKEHILFHNHTEDGYRKNYSLIQYKIIRKKAALVCLEEGIEEVQHFFNHFEGQLQIQSKKVPADIDSLVVNRFNIGTYDHTFRYRIKNWLPFNVENYQKYHKHQYVSEKTEFLENILRSNILSLAGGIGWNVEKEIIAKITRHTGHKILTVKNTKKEAMSLEFETNVFLPNYIGLGRHVSLGYGGVKEVKTKVNYRK